jgi:hypothetical protein
MRIDVHQHIWTEPWLDALAARRAPPCIVRTDGLTVLHCAGERPLVERLASRGGPQVELGDSLTLYDSSSFGPTAVQAMALQVGTAQLVYGSDQPMLEPHRTALDALLQENSARLLNPLYDAATVDAA